MLPSWVPTPIRRLAAEDLARGAGVNVLFTVLNGLLGLLAAALAARALGPAGIGIVGIGFLLVEFASVVDNIPTPAFIREYAHRPGREQVATVLVTKGAIGLALTLLILAISPLVASAFDVPIVVPLIYAFIPLASIIDSVAIMSWEARRDMLRRNAPGTIENVSKTLLYLVVAVTPALATDAVVAISVATLAASVIGTIAGFFLIPSLRVSGFELDRARRYASFGVRTAASGFMLKIIFWVDIAVIDLVLGHAQQGLYRLAYTLMAYTTLFANTVVVILYPTVAAAHADGRTEDVRRALSLGFFYSFTLVAPLALLLALFPEFFITLAFGEAFAPAAWMLRALALVGLLGVVLLPFEAFLPAIGRPDVFLGIVSVEVAINVALDVLLIPRMGVAGGILATAVTFAAGILMNVVALRRLGVPLPRLRDVADVLAGRASPKP